MAKLQLLQISPLISPVKWLWSTLRFFEISRLHIGHLEPCCFSIVLNSSPVIPYLLSLILSKNICLFLLYLILAFRATFSLFALFQILSCPNNLSLFSKDHFFLYSFLFSLATFSSTNFLPSLGEVCPL